MLYSRFIKLCELKNVAPSRVVQEIGYDKSTASYWKKSAQKNNNINIDEEKEIKLADYFSVSIDYLNGNDLYADDNSLDKLANDFSEYRFKLDNPYKMLLLDEAEGMTEKSLEQVIRMMRVIKGMQDD